MIRMLTAFLTAIVLSLTAQPASAQFGLGFGWGGGLFNNQPNSQNVVDAINQRSLVRSQAAYANAPKPVTEPRFESRDDSFYQKYDYGTRVAMIDRVARHPGQEMGTADPSGVLPRPVAPPRPPTTAAAPTPPTAPPRPQVVLLGNYFNKTRQLVWPAESPTTGDLAAKRDAADLAALTVLSEYESRGVASMATVVNARKQLQAYGQPALAYVREHSTPAIADSFHAFLLTLYGEIGDVYTIPMSQR